jgi:hypothetical protein
MATLWSADLGIPIGARAESSHQADGHGQPLPRNDLQSLGKRVKHRPGTTQRRFVSPCANSAEFSFQQHEKRNCRGEGY